MKIKKLGNLLASLLLALAVAVPVSAAEQPGTFNASLLGALAWYGDDRLDGGPDTGVAVGVGYNFTRNWALETLFTFTNVSPNNGVGSDTAQYVNLSALYNFDSGTKLTPYLAVGYGEREHDLPGLGGHEDMVNVGGGIKYGLSERVAFRVDLRYLISTEESGDWDDVHLLAGLQFALTPPAPAPAPVSEPAPAPAPQPAPMGPGDGDGDGVTDDKDKCPNTPIGTEVDADGCPVVVAPERMEIKVEFDFDSAAIRPAYHAALGDVAAFMQKYPTAVATIEGHTDSTGPDSYNQGLSERRANSVRDYLISNKQIAADRLKTVGYGESRPVADNATREGRQRNRRVIAVIIETR